MAKTKVSEFDAVASNNTDINSVNVAEGCPPSGINNAIREMASLLKKQEVGTDAMTSPDINGGTIDGATIGGSSGVTIGVSDGTVSAPSIKFTSDTNTGIYRGGTDILKFVTAGTDAITIDASQQVGIGVSPTHALTVQYNAGTTTAKFQNTNTSGTSIDSATLTLLSASRDAGINITSNSSRASALNFGDEINAARGRIIYDNSDDSLEIQTAALQRINISSGGDISFYEDTGTTPKLFWDASAERLGIGTASPANALHVKGATTVAYIESTGTNGDIQLDASGTTGYTAVRANNNDLAFLTNTAERMRIDNSGNLLVGTTTNGTTADGTVIRASGEVLMTRTNGQPLLLNRRTSTGNLMEFRFNNVAKGVLGTDGSSNMYFACERGAGIGLSDQELIPTNANGVLTDNFMDVGHPSYRFDDVRATNGTIQTSDRNEKNTITDSDLGIDFIKRLTPKSYIFNGKTRTHYGLIAQDVETVLTDISKPTSGFAGFIKDDISEEQDGSEYRYGLRYTEFVAPLIQAVKDQQATIDALTARITALENGE